LVEIKGLEKLASKDFPGHISATVFVGGCNFRCPFCHNRELVLHPDELESFPVDYFTSFLDSREGWLEGVCITGGEPLIHEDLDVLMQLIKDRGLKVKLDTNGSFPSRLEAALDKGLVDSVAMDIKASKDDYSRACGVNVNLDDIQRSIDLIAESGLDAMFRTTVVPGVIDEDTINAVCQWLPRKVVFQLQQFSPGNTLKPDFEKLEPYPPSRLRDMAAAAEKYFSEVRVEGI
jgi:pyruvate formate lyase activating enzyme